MSEFRIDQEGLSPIMNELDYLWNGYDLKLGNQVFINANPIIKIYPICYNLHPRLIPIFI